MRIRVLDLETTGDAPPEHGVCEIGWCDLIASHFDLAMRPTRWTVSPPRAMRANPGVPIPASTSAVHHLIDEDVCDSPPWCQALEQVLTTGMSDIVAFAAHSAKFERAWCDSIAPEMPWLCTYKGALRLWPEAPSHSNQALRYHRRPAGLDRNLAMPAHRAGPDAYVTAHHLRDQLEQLTAEGKDAVKALTEWSLQPALQVTCHIGKQRGMKWADVDYGFLEWLLDKDFDEDVLFTARYWIEQHDKREQEEREAYERERAAAARDNP